MPSDDGLAALERYHVKGGDNAGLKGEREGVRLVDGGTVVNKSIGKSDYAPERLVESITGYFSDVLPGVDDEEDVEMLNLKKDAFP